MLPRRRFGEWPFHFDAPQEGGSTSALASLFVRVCGVFERSFKYRTSKIVVYRENNDSNCCGYEADEITVKKNH
jgi:hypothetical protein